MTDATYDVVGIGNAIMDVLATVDDAFIADHALEKGAMMLIDAERALYLSGKLEESQMRSGGSAGNTIAGMAELGARSAFFGKVADDAMGETYKSDMTALGIHFPTAMLVEREPTARSIIVITPDGERTMNTYLGACTEIGPEDMDQNVVRASKIIYFEGYLWDPPRAKDALRKAAKVAHAAGQKVAITLSDSFCVDRYRSEFLALIEDKTVDILLANEMELLSLYETQDLDSAVKQVAETCEIAAITRSEKGALVIENGDVSFCEPFEVDHVVDSTGAGDMFAAGFLFGITRGMPMPEAGRLGCLLASKIIQVIGPRLDDDLKEIAKAHGFNL